MALILADRVRDTTTTTGTGTVTLSGTAPTGYQNFSVIGNGNTTYYTINAGSQWEVGIGTYSSTGPTLSRDTVLESSNANALVNFAAGTKDVFVTYPSDKSVIQDGATITAGTAVLGVANGGTGLSSTPANGAIDIGNGTGFTRTTLTAGTNISITNGAGSITINATDQFVGTVTSVAASGGTTGMTFSGSPITTSGTLTLGGTLNVANGGTGATTLSSGYLLRGNGTSAVNSSIIFDNGTNVGIGTSSPGYTLDVAVGGSAGATLDIARMYSAAGGTSTARLLFGSAANPVAAAIGGQTTTASDGALTFYTEGNGTLSERMRIDSAGNVGIDSSSPGAKFDVYGGAVGGTAGNELNITRSFGAAGGNTARLLTTLLRTSNGSDWTTTSLRLRGVIDGTEMSYLAMTLPGVGGMAFGTGFGATSERMRIDSSGNVGIGTSSPAYKLDVAGTAANTIAGARDTTGYALFRAANNDAITFFGQDSTGGAISGSASASLVWGNNNRPMLFATNNTERMRIDSSGNLLVGTTSASYSFAGRGLIETNGSSTAFNVLKVGGTAIAYLGCSASVAELVTPGAVPLTFLTNNTERMRIDSAGNVGIGTSSPSGGNAPLTIQNVGGSGSQINFRNAATTDAFVGLSGDANGDLISYLGSAKNQIFYTNAAERMRIDSSGNLLVGKTAANFDATGVEYLASSKILRSTTSSNAALQLQRLTTDGDIAQFWNAGSIAGSVSVSSTNLYLGASGFLGFSAGGSERVRLTSGGDVGIGTSSPVSKLDVSGVVNSNNSIAVTAAGSDSVGAGPYFYLRNSTSTTSAWVTQLGASGSYDFWNFTSGPGWTQRARIDNSGNMALGNSAIPYVTANRTVFAVNGTSSALIGLQSAGANRGYLYGDGSIIALEAESPCTLKFNAIGAQPMTFFTNNTERMRITAAGNVGINISNPSVRFSVSGDPGDPTLNAASGIAEFRLSSTQMLAIGGYGSGSFGVWLQGKQDNSGYTNNTWPIILQPSGGNVGIGTASPATRLQVETGSDATAITCSAISSTSSQLRLGIGGFAAGVPSITGTGNGLTLVASDAAALRFGTSNTERMRLDASGNLLLGTSATTNTGQVISTAGANFSSTATKDSNMTGLTVSAAANVNTMTGVWFATGNAVHWSGIAGARTNHTVDWSTHLAFYTHPADFTNIDSAFERMRIDGAGNVGIGTTAPASLLHVKRGSNATEVYPSGTWAGRIINATDNSGENGLLVGNRWAGTGSTVFEVGSIFGGGTGSWYSYYRIDGTGQSIWSNNGTERMRLDTSGNVGIGTSTPAAPLQVVGPGRFGAGPGDATNATLAMYSDGTGVSIEAFQGNNVGVKRNLWLAAYGGNVGIGTSTPGVRLDVAGGDIRIGNNRAMSFINAAGTATARYTLQNDDNFVVYNAAGTPISSFTQGATNIAVYGSNASNRMTVDSINNITSWTVNGSERARIDGFGQFLIGTTVGGRTVCINAADNWIRQSNPSRSWLIGPANGSDYNIYDETAGTNRFRIDTAGNLFGNNAIILGSGVNNDNRIEVGQARTGNNFAYIDLIGDTTYTDFGLRLLRGDTGPNTFSQLFHRGTGDFQIGNIEAAALTFRTSNTERMRISASGGVAIGGTGTDASLHIQTSYGGYDRLTQMSPSAANKPALNIAASKNSGGSDQWWSWGVQTDNTWKIQAGVGFGGNGISIDNSGNLTASGNVTAYSDARLKKDVETISGALDLVSKMRGVRYTRIDTENRNVGVIAQEMLEVVPEVVQQGVGDDDTLSVAYGNLVGVLIEAIKELRAEVAELKGK